MLGWDRRQVDQLKGDILVRHHAGLGMLGRERIRRDVGTGSGKTIVQRRLAGIGRTDQRDLGGTFRPYDQRGTAVSAASPRSLELFRERLDARLDVGLEMLRALV